MCQVPQALDALFGYAPGLGGHLRIDVEDGVGAVPDAEPFQAVAEGVTGYALQQDFSVQGALVGWEAELLCGLVSLAYRGRIVLLTCPAAGP